MDEEPLTAGGAGGAGAEGGGFACGVDGFIGEDDGALFEFVFDAAAEFPARDIDGERVRVEELDEFLLLIAADWEVVDGAESEGGVGWLGWGDTDACAEAVGGGVDGEEA